MFFLMRSALCIGLVTCAASSVGRAPLAAAMERSMSEAATGAVRTCLGSRTCTALSLSAATATGVAVAPPPWIQLARAAADLGSPHPAIRKKAAPRRPS